MSTDMCDVGGKYRIEDILTECFLERMPQKVVKKLAGLDKKIRERLQKCGNAFWRVKLMREFDFSSFLPPPVTEETLPNRFFKRYLSHVVNQRLIAAGCFHALAVCKRGQIVAWGDDQHGQVSGAAAALAALPDANRRCFVSIDAGWTHSVGLLDDGQVVCWGNDDFGQVSGIAGALAALPDAKKRHFVAICAGAHHSLGLLDNGQVIGWGWDHSREATGGAAALAALDGRRFVSISASNHSIGLLDNGQVVGWGFDAHHAGATGAAAALAMLPNGAERRFISISAASSRSLGLLDNGQVIGWGTDWFQCATGAQRALEALFPNENGRRFVAISAGHNQSLGLLDNGIVVGWGSRSEGFPKDAIHTRLICNKLGCTCVKDSCQCRQAIAYALHLHRAVAICAGIAYCMCVLSDGEVMMWGKAVPPVQAIPSTLRVDVC